ncbi:unnamed protein product [Arabidopsis arenosa]|uniref:Zinc finger BED domain-containing protein RICESLEEPER 2-like n=1 Tax=Arabidopsis arenosa TaxID=38785 RepID=A0A8S1ZMI5_ARAAE|nr:unnamed protein product [Arabidopsis arenosa]
MIVLDELPSVFVEKVGFSNFCKAAIPQFTIPSRRTITRDIVELYYREKAMLMSFFSAYKQRVCLATDIWTAPTTSVSYMVVTAHFIDPNWCLHRKVISFRPISNHRGETIGNQLVSCLDEWGIQKVFTVTVDNASANDSGIKHLKENVNFSGDESLILGGEYMHVRCAAHILNLIVRDGLAKINKSVVAIRNAVKYVRSSDKRFKSFHMRLGLDKKVSRGSLPLDCTTRWNSTYLMLDSALKYRSTFDKLGFEDRPYDTYFQEEENGVKILGPPTSVDWDDVTRLVGFLEGFYQSTLVFSAYSKVTSNTCYDEICTIEAHLTAMKKSQDKDVQSMVTPMKEKFDKYWDGVKKINKMLIIASVLDPRCKMEFVTSCFEDKYGKGSTTTETLKKEVLDLLDKLFDTYSGFRSKKMDGSSSSSQDGSVVEPVVSCEIGRGFRNTKFSRYSQMQSQKKNDDVANELTIYLLENVEVPQPNPLGLPYDILSWWKTNSTKFPILAELARDVLAFLVSNVSSESVFSTGDRILDPYRSSLTPFMVETLILLQNWLKTSSYYSDACVDIGKMLEEPEYMESLHEEINRQLKEANRG